MRFSIRVLLAATAYVALVLAAIATGSELLPELIWVISFFAICFAVVVACIARHEKQAIALGFVTLATANLVGLYLVPNQLPVARVFSAAGYIFHRSGTVYLPTAPTGEWRAIPRIRPIVRTANAASTLAAGLIGCLIGRLAYLYASRNDRQLPRARHE